MTLHYFSLHHGKHEDLSLAHLSISHTEGFETPLAAMFDFRCVLLEHVRARIGWYEKKRCCQSHLNRPVNSHSPAVDKFFCPTCGTSLEPPDPQDEATEVVDLYMRLFGEGTGTLNNAAGLLRRFEDKGWEISHPPTPPVVIVNVNVWLDWVDDKDEEGLSEPMPFMEATFPDGTTWSTFEECPE